MFSLRFDMRAPVGGAASTVDLYRAAIDMAAWAEDRDCQFVMLSEHHSSPDGYLPSPVVLASAIAARTTRVPIIVGALLLNLYEPVKLAEDMLVLDIISGGRVSYVIGLGYRPEEYAMFGLDMAERGRLMDRKLTTLRAALGGHQFHHDGRAVRVTPAPTRAAGPRLMYGGHSLAAARRAGRHGLDFFAERSDPALRAAYDAAAADAGVQPGACMLPSGDRPTSLFVAEDLDAAWEQLGPHLLHDARMYAAWMGDEHAASSRSDANTVAQLRAENGPYRIVTPGQAIDMGRAGHTLSLQPLSGGIPPELAWPSVRLVGEVVMPALRAAGRST